MQKPDFNGIYRRAKPRAFRHAQPQAIAPAERIYKCECCNDTGTVQAWKLDKFAKGSLEHLDPTMSNPVFCQQFITCGQLTLQVFSERGNDEDGERTAKLGLFSTPKGENTLIGSQLGDRQLLALSREQSKFIHDSVIEYRKQLASTAPGREYVETVKQRCRTATAATAEDGLIRLFAPVEMPAEPDFTEGCTRPKSPPRSGHAIPLPERERIYDYDDNQPF